MYLVQYAMSDLIPIILNFKVSFVDDRTIKLSFWFAPTILSFTGPFAEERLQSNHHVELGPHPSHHHDVHASL